MDLQTEIEHLRLADEHVGLAVRFAERQQAIVRWLISRDLDATEARRLLETMWDTQAVACEHRALIFRMVNQLASESADTGERRHP